jgi:hypothetical protein
VFGVLGGAPFVRSVVRLFYVEKPICCAGDLGVESFAGG